MLHLLVVRWSQLPMSVCIDASNFVRLISTNSPEGKNECLRGCKKMAESSQTVYCVKNSGRKIVIESKGGMEKLHG